MNIGTFSRISIQNFARGAMPRFNRFAMLVLSFIGLVAVAPIVVGSEFSSPQCQIDLPRSTPSEDFALSGDDSVVLHLPTGLIWQRCAYGMDLEGTFCSGEETLLTWQEALNVAESMGEWRLPNPKELMSIVEECRADPAINYWVFPDRWAWPSNNPPRPYYWSSSPLATSSGTSAWSVAVDGYIVSRPKSEMNMVRLIRSTE